MSKASKFKRAVAVVGSYKDRNTGEEKKRYVGVGTLFRYEDGGLSMKLDSVPLGWDGWVSFYEFEDKPKGDSYRTPKPEGRTPMERGELEDADQSIPF